MSLPSRIKKLLRISVVFTTVPSAVMDSPTIPFPAEIAPTEYHESVFPPCPEIERCNVPLLRRQATSDLLVTPFYQMSHPTIFLPILTYLFFFFFLRPVVETNCLPPLLFSSFVRPIFSWSRYLICASYLSLLFYDLRDPNVGVLVTVRPSRLAFFPRESFLGGSPSSPSFSVCPRSATDEFPF